MISEPIILRVRSALAKVRNPATGKSLLSEGRITGLEVDPDGVAHFTLETPTSDRAAAEALLAKARAAALGVDGVSKVSAVATAKAPPSAAPRPSGHDNPIGLKKKPRVEQAGETLTGITNVIAVASGKGGVGKSTVAANLAIALARRGLKVGLMDADIYGPSLPTLFGLSGRPQTEGEKIVPVDAFGVKAMSIGLMVDEGTALAWRGPMVMGAIRQLIGDVAWGDLDVLLIDTPPGTGDAHLSLIQSKRLTGVVIVSTPQEMALADVRRGIELFRKTDIPILGVIENMAWLEGADGSRQYLFGEGGAQKAAAAMDATFLGAVPLYPDLRLASDEGAPLTTAAPKSAAAMSFYELAEKVSATIIQ